MTHAASGTETATGTEAVARTEAATGTEAVARTEAAPQTEAATGTEAVARTEAAPQTEAATGTEVVTGTGPAVDAGQPFAALPERNLDKRELRALVDGLADRPDLWRGQVAFSDTERHYASLYRDEFVDVWLLCWTRKNDTGWHDHDISSGAVRVVQGVLTESNPRIGGEHPATAVGAGSSFCFGPDHIHRLTGATDDAVSVHAYSPPLWRLGQYDITEDGLLRRVSVSYADELRPIGDPASSAA